MKRSGDVGTVCAAHCGIGGVKSCGSKTAFTQHAMNGDPDFVVGRRRDGSAKLGGHCTTERM